MRYKTYDDIPCWGKEAVKYYMDKGTLKGTGNGILNLSDDMVRLLVIQCPVVYKSLEDVPEWGKHAVETLINEGALKGTGEGINLTLEMLRVMVVDETSQA